MNYVKSKQRVADHGEVFTPAWMVEAMLDLVKDFHLLVGLKVFNTEQMNQAVFAFRRYEDASLRYTGIDSHPGLTHYGLYDTVVAREGRAVRRTCGLTTGCGDGKPIRAGNIPSGPEGVPMALPRSGGGAMAGGTGHRGGIAVDLFGLQCYTRLRVAAFALNNRQPSGGLACQPGCLFDPSAPHESLIPLGSHLVEQMQNDKLNQTLLLKDGRHLGFAEYGEPMGCPVFHFHGSGGSRLDHPSSESILTRLNIRFISVDRPGNGLSDFQPHRRIIDWSKDIGQLVSRQAGNDGNNLAKTRNPIYQITLDETLADHLGIDQFFVEGHSAGGPHVLACAHQLPERVIAGALISSAAPMSRPNAYEGMPILNQILARSARHFPWSTRIIRWMMRSMVMGDPEIASRRLMSSIPDADKVVLYSPQNAEIFVSALREGFRLGSRGVAQDDTLINQEWGFDLTYICPRIDIWHGQADVNVPIHAAQYLQAMLPQTRATFLPGEGHFFLFQRWEEILSALVHDKGKLVLQTPSWLTKRAPDWWESARFQAVSWAQSWFHQMGVVSSRPPPGNACR